VRDGALAEDIAVVPLAPKAEDFTLKAEGPLLEADLVFRERPPWRVRSTPPGEPNFTSWPVRKAASRVGLPKRLPRRRNQDPPTLARTLWRGKDAPPSP